MDTIIKCMLNTCKDKLLNHSSKIIIGISGPSGAGKTWLANKIKEMKSCSVSIFTLDSYYKDLNYINTLDFHHDNPNAIDYSKALEDLELLLAGEDIRIPIHDYKHHLVVGEKNCKSTPIIIIEGLFAFIDRRILDKIDLKVWVKAVEDVRFARRMNRDVQERGDTSDQVKKRYMLDVKPAYKKYIQPYKKYADLLLDNSENNDEIVRAIRYIMYHCNI